MGDETKTALNRLGDAVTLRMNAILAARSNRECILKTFVLNQYEMLLTGCGFVVEARALNVLVVRTFEQVIDTDRKTARPKLIEFRRKLIEKYPDWIPNRLALIFALTSMGKRYCDQAAAHGLAIIKKLEIDSDEYAQLFINCRHDPLSPRKPWITGNARPWHLPQRLLEAAGLPKSYADHLIAK